MSGDDQPHVLVTGVVPPGPSGMRDYGDLLAADLRKSGGVDVRWATNEGRQLRATTEATRELFAIARRTHQSTTVVWNYAPMTSGYRGLPGPAVLLGGLLRLRRVPVIVVLHELAEPWRGQPASTRIRSLAALIALGPVLLASSAWVVTTERRARRLAPLGRALRRPIRFIPVFSNLGEKPAPSPARRDDRLAVGVLDYAATFARPDVVVGALRELQDEGLVTMHLIGAPGPGTPKALRWCHRAKAAGLDGVEFSGILPVDLLGQQLAQMDVIVLPNAQGPASRKGTLAAALAHGRPIVSLDGPMRWDRLVDAGAVLVVPPEAPALAQALRHLWAEPGARGALGAAAIRFYAARMSVERAANAFRELLPAPDDRGSP